MRQQPGRAGVADEVLAADEQVWFVRRMSGCGACGGQTGRPLL